MAGERIGKTYEALLKIVLEKMREEKVFEGKVFWNEIPEDISVEPDFSIGPDKDHPTIYIMVTHSGSSKNSDMKCWRNLGELCEAKIALKEMPKALNIIFEGAIKTTLKALQEAAFDGQIIVSDKEYGKRLQQWVHKKEPLLPTDQNEKVKAMQQLIEVDKELAELLSNLKKDVSCELNKSNNELNQLWNFERGKKKHTPPHSKITSVRRGISKLFIFPDIEKAIDLYEGKRVSPKAFPDYIYSIGLAKIAIGRAAPNDPEITGAIALLDRKSVVDLYHTMDDNEIVQGWIFQLRNIHLMKYYGAIVSQKYDELCNKEKLHDYIIRLHDDPEILSCEEDVPDNWPPSYVWLVPYLMEVIKTSTGKANGYGIAQLATDVIGLGYGSVDDLASASQFGGGFLNVWLNRNPSPFRMDLIEGVAAALSLRLSELGKNDCIKIITSGEVEKTMINNLIEAKLCTYRLFEPLFFLLSRTIPEIRQEKVRTCFAEKAQLSGQTGKTTIAIIKHTIINWQTATDSGRDHKRKELCGRAIGLRYSWNSDKEVFEPRPGIKKLILLLDGTWRQKDINALIDSGWDEIYYPDELNKLKASII